MRLWSIHPAYLDRIGLVALWREALLAQQVLLGRTRGYRHHPQLHRFRAAGDAVAAIGCYLAAVADEAQRRGYRFDRDRIAHAASCTAMPLHEGQLEYEWRHLLAKLQIRSPADYEKNRTVTLPAPHPLFALVPGGVEEWERA